MKQVKNNEQVYELANVHQFEDGKIAGLMVQQGEANCDKILQSYHAGYFQAINDLMVQWNKGCTCGEQSSGQTWCCNLCGLPSSDKNKPEQTNSKISKEKCLELFHTALCNSMMYTEGHGISIDYDVNEYKAAKSKLISNGEVVAYEDIIIQILKDGNKITIIDEEGGVYTTTISIEDVYERLPDAPEYAIKQMINEEDDAITGDTILQYVFFNEVLFG